MSLVKKIATLSLALGLSFSALDKMQGQMQVANITSNNIELDSKNIKGITRPLGEPALSLDVSVKKGVLPSVKLGEVEVRENNLYANLMFGYYQIMFEKVNDSTFVEHLFSRNLSRGSERYEIFTTNKRVDSSGISYFVLSGYDILVGEPRDEKIPLKNKIYSSDYVTAVTALDKFMKNQTPDNLSILVLGVDYAFNLYEKREPIPKSKEPNKMKVTKFAKISEVVKTSDDVFLMEEYINLHTIEERVMFNGRDTVMMYPQSFEGRFTVINSGIWNGKYKAEGIVKK